MAEIISSDVALLVTFNQALENVITEQSESQTKSQSAGAMVESLQEIIQKKGESETASQ